MSEEEMFNILKNCYVVTTKHCLDEDNINLKQAIQKIVSLYQSQKEKIQYLEDNIEKVLNEYMKVKKDLEIKKEIIIKLAIKGIKDE